MHQRHTDKLLYFNEQAYTTETYVIPFIRKTLNIDAATRVLEIGCGEGGNLKPFLDLGCKVTGIDILPNKIENANKFLEGHPHRGNARFIVKDIYLAEDDLRDKFDLILMRDVIEHIHDQERFMGFVRQFLATGGVFFLAFPPWYNPFGGHQQVLNSRILSKLPYFHILPARMVRMILKTFGEPREKIDGFLEIKETGISIERFMKIIRKHQYRVLQETHFFINPNYEVKFGLKPRKQVTLINSIPFFRNFLTTACYILIKAE